MSEPIDIVVTDKIPTGIREKLLNIATAALEGANSVERLQRQLNSINPQALNQLAQAQRALAATQAQSAIQQAPTAAAQTQAATAAQRLAAATTGAQTAQARLTQAQAQAAAASSRAAAAALRLQQAQEKVAESSNNILGPLGKISAALGTAFSIRELVSLGDAYTTLQNKLQNVSTTQGQVAELTERLFDIANRTRAPVEETATAFTRFDRALKSLGKSQDESLRLTETVNKALIVSGATATESASALLQLSQAFNSGKLQGDEFRSVAENLPIVLDAVAKATGTPINQVKKLASEGKITSEVLFKAFKLIETQIDATFAKTVPTVGQALVVLRNNALQTFGEFNKATGITENLAKAILFLSQNMKAVGVALAAVTAILAVAFAPTVIAGVVALAGALAAVLTPIGLIIVGITAAAAALYAYGDSANIAADSSVTFKDVAKSAFDLVAQAAKDAATFLKDNFNSAIDAINTSFPDLGNVVTGTLSVIGIAAKETINFFIGGFIFGFNAIKLLYGGFPGVFEFAFKSAANFAIESAEKILNSYQSVFREIADLLGKVAPNIASSINETLDKVKINLPKFDIGDDAKAAANQVAGVFGDAFAKDYVADVKKAVLDGAEIIAQNRQEQERLLAKLKGNQLRGSGPNTNVPDADKNAIKRSTFLQKITGELDKQIASYGQLAEVRAVQEKLDEYDIELQSKKLAKLTANERASLQSKLEQIQVNKRVTASQDEIYANAIGPQQKYEDGLKAIGNLQKLGALTTDKLETAQRKLTYDYLQAIDPLFLFNKEMDQQNKLLESNLDAKQRAGAQQVNSINNGLEAQGKPKLDSGQENQVLEQVAKQQKLNEVTQAYDAIIAQNKGAYDQLTVQQEALNKAQAAGVITADQYATATTNLAIQKAKLNLDTGAGSQTDLALASVGRLLDGYKNVLSGLSDSFSSFFETLDNGFADSIGKAIVRGDSLKDSLTEVAKTGVEGLISSLVKLGIQYVLNAALGESIQASALATSTALSVGAATATAAAWAPAAAAVSLASFGANSIPAAAGITSTYALTEALSLLSGFQSGGYTGNGGVSDIAGLVHGKEFVVNAAGTAANRSTLEAMNRGQSVGTGTPKITIEDHTSGGVSFTAAQGLSEGEIRLIARDEVANHAPKVIAGELASPNSTTSKSLKNNYQVAPAR